MPNMPTPKKKTTQKATRDKAEYWAERVSEYTAYFGLLDYEWIMNHEYAPGADHLARFEIDHVNRQVKVTLNEHFLGEADLEELDKCAFHEVYEIMLAPLSRMAHRVMADNQVYEAVHRIVKIAENQLYPLVRDKIKGG